MTLHEWAEEVKTIRESLGLSQRELALRAGLHFMTYTLIESGKGNPTFKTMASILQALQAASAEAQEKQRKIPNLLKMGVAS